MSAAGDCGNMHTGAKIAGYRAAQRAIRSLLTRAQAVATASSPIWGCMAEARGLKMVMSAPRSRSRRSWFVSKVSRIWSSEMAG